MVIMIGACDLQPRILSLPDSVGDFISARYPALLADPDSQPEIYNSAASDYGVYASPELYGGGDVDDYVLYADVADYMLPAVAASMDAGPDVTTGETITAPVVAVVEDDVISVPMYGGAADTRYVTVVAGDTLYSIGRRVGATVDEIAAMNNLAAPYALAVGQKLKVPGNGDVIAVAPAEKNVAPVAPDVISVPARAAVTPVTKVRVDRVTVGPGDTLYSISRKYSVPVNDLAVMNDLSAPFGLRVGQQIKVPNLGDSVPVAAAAVAPTSVVAVKTKQASVATTPAAPVNKQNAKTSKSVTQTVAKKSENNTAKTSGATPSAPVKKISSNPKQKLPKISARSSSKFSWPVRGKILSDYGSKSGGLFNDGINISAARGTPVKAAENGVVAYAGNEVKGMGNLIIIQHTGGWMTVYAHMDSMVLRRGAKVSVGQKIGTVGSTGKVNKPQLHFEIRKGTRAYNPSSYLKQ